MILSKLVTRLIKLSDRIFPERQVPLKVDTIRAGQKEGMYYNCANILFSDCQQ